MKNKKPKSIVRRIFRVIGIVLLAVVVLLAGMVGFLSVTEFKPADRETAAVSGTAARTLRPGDALTLVSWNIGYGALGDNADFFMDGGSMVKTADKARVEQNMNTICTALDDMQPDILLAQETDRNSSRSSHVNEYAALQDHLAGYTSSFAGNFKVAFLPYPVPPIGKVDSGLATYSAFSVSSAERVQLPVPFSWPMRMANLKRCVLISRIPIEDSERELVIVNLHLEAYDDGEGKAAQTKMLAELLSAEAAKGNYVVAGGDFNQIFSTANADAFPIPADGWTVHEIDVTQFDGAWQFLMDETVPSCRSLYKTYAGADKDTFRYYIIDGFIVSGNLTVDDFATQDLDFTASDHNPVFLRVTISEAEK